MEGANVNGLISSTVGTLESATREYNIINDDKSLQPSFYEAGRGLLLIVEALQTVQTHLDGHNLEGDPTSAISLLEVCYTKAKLSERIFRDVAQAPKTSRVERYKAAVRQEGNGATIEVLVKGMMKNVYDLAKGGAIEEAMKDKVKELHDAIEKLSTMDPSVSNAWSGTTFTSYGTASQFNNLGGTQNNSSGSGYQFPGANFGTANFGKSSSE